VPLVQLGEAELERLVRGWRRGAGSWFQRRGEAYWKERSVIRREDNVDGRASVTKDQTRRPPLLLPIDGTDRRSDRQTDARPFHRPCSHTMRAVSKMHIATLFVLRQCRHCCWIVLCLNLMGQLSCLAKVLWNTALLFLKIITGWSYKSKIGATSTLRVGPYYFRILLNRAIFAVLC